jgi:hypothetical protein
VGRRTRGVRGVICMLSRDVETAGAMIGSPGVGISLGGGRGERLYRLRDLAGIRER